MTPAEMAEQCRKQVALYGNDAEVMFRMPGRWGTGTKRLFGRRGGPVGRVIAEEAETVLVMFRAVDALNAIENALEVISDD